MTDKHAANGTSPNRQMSNSLSSSNGNASSTVGEGSRAESRSSHRDVRTLPSWIHSVTASDLEEVIEVPDTDEDVIAPPIQAQIAQHVHAPASNRHRPAPGRLHDANRDRSPLIIRTPTEQHASRWRSFATASAPLTSSIATGKRVDTRWLTEHMPDLERPCQTGRDDGDDEKHGLTKFTSRVQRKAWYTRLQRALVRNPLVPLALRLTIWSFSLVALALGGSIHSLSSEGRQRSSTVLAMTFDSVALIYLFYITYDEYSSKPLGLRSPKAKMRLILLDLFFIVFNSATLSLAFDALADTNGGCKGRAGADMRALCHRQRALTAVLLVALVAWLLTFAVTAFRIVERVARE